MAGAMDMDQETYMTSTSAKRLEEPDLHAGWLQNCAQGKQAALSELYKNEAAQMIGVAQRIVRRREIAEDIVQETFVQIWRKASLYDPTLGSARGWIYTILRNLSLNAIRNERHTPTADDELSALADAANDLEEPFDRLGDGKALKICLGTLDPQRRASILLAYVWGYSHGEIAGRLRLPLGTVKAWIRRSLVSLKTCLGEAPASPAQTLHGSRP